MRAEHSPPPLPPSQPPPHPSTGQLSPSTAPSPQPSQLGGAQGQPQLGDGGKEAATRCADPAVHEGTAGEQHASPSQDPFPPPHGDGAGGRGGGAEGGDPGAVGGSGSTQCVEYGAPSTATSSSWCHGGLHHQPPPGFGPPPSPLPPCPLSCAAARSSPPDPPVAVWVLCGGWGVHPPGAGGPWHAAGRWWQPPGRGTTAQREGRRGG